MLSQVLDFTNMNVLVVGGSSGIGNGIAQAFLDRGAVVYVWGTRATRADYPDGADSTLEGLHYQQLDATDSDAVSNYLPPFDRLDVLVLSQGIVLYQRAEFEIAAFRRVIDVNLNSLMICASKFQSMLSQARGSLIVVSSTAAVKATKGNPAYGASKTGAYGLTRTLGQAWAPIGIRVNGVAPGMVETRLTKATTDIPSRKAKFLESVPLGRFGTTQDIANAVLFLSSPLASYIVGQTLIVDGGFVL
jgi:3-oxoacyl-[acyl-carrier protein] reductase